MDPLPWYLSSYHRVMFKKDESILENDLGPELSRLTVTTYNSYFSVAHANVYLANGRLTLPHSLWQLLWSDLTAHYWLLRTHISFYSQHRGDSITRWIYWTHCGQKKHSGLHVVACFHNFIIIHVNKSLIFSHKQSCTNGARHQTILKFSFWNSTHEQKKIHLLWT